VALSRCRFGPATNMSLPYEHFSILCGGLVVRRTECRMRSSILARGWGSMEGTAVCAFGPIGARLGGGDRPARQIAGWSL
jgi:hypothetical protein